VPGFDGTGPQGKGPMTGRVMGFCVLRESAQAPGRLEGLIGADGKVLTNTNNNIAEHEKEVTDMPFGDGTGPRGMGPMKGRAAGFCAGYAVPGYMNPVGARGFAPVAAPYGYGPTAHGYGLPYAPVGPWFGRGLGWPGRGRGFGRGWGRGRGRGRFGYWW